MVKKVNEWKKARPVEYGELIKAYDEANEKTISSLKSLARDFSEESLSEFKKYFEEQRLWKKKLGTESGAPIEEEKYSQLIAESNENGAFVSILPGAGGGDSIASLCLSVEEKEKLKAFWQSKGHAPLDLELSNEGVRIEEA
jgi:phosphomevalonate kinase